MKTNLVSAQRAEDVLVSCAEDAEGSIRPPTPDEAFCKPQPGDQLFFSEHPPQTSVQDDCTPELLLAAEGWAGDAPSAG